MSPDEAIFRDHLTGAPFQSGADAGKWALQGQIAWPTAVFWIQSATRFVAAGRVLLKFDLQNYPQLAPTASPWDDEKHDLLNPEVWPKGPGNVSAVFNPRWNPRALYAPCDRVAMQGHEAWMTKFPQWWWNSSFTFVHYLEFVHRCLNPDCDT
jgi:hypothetical protein